MDFSLLFFAYSYLSSLSLLALSPHTPSLRSYSQAAKMGMKECVNHNLFLEYPGTHTRTRTRTSIHVRVQHLTQTYAPISLRFVITTNFTWPHIAQNVNSITISSLHTYLLTCFTVLTRPIHSAVREGGRPDRACEVHSAAAVGWNHEDHGTASTYWLRCTLLCVIRWMCVCMYG